MPKITVLELAKLIVSQVHYALPVGATNLSTSKEKSGEWGDKLILAARDNYDGSFRWDRTQIKKTTWEPQKDKPQKNNQSLKEDSWCLGHLIKTIKYPANAALCATLTKVGNCHEMSELGMLYLCRYAHKHFCQNDKFSFQILNTNMDHLMLKITLNGQSAICDPWINFTAEINSVVETGVKRSHSTHYRMKSYFDLLEKEGIKNTPEECNDDDDDDDVIEDDIIEDDDEEPAPDRWEIFDNELCDDTGALIDFSIKNLEQAQATIEAFDQGIKKYFAEFKKLKETRAPLLYSFKPSGSALTEQKAKLKPTTTVISHQVKVII